MKGKILVLSSFTCLFSSALFAQQDKLITHFMYDKMSLNPAATGINEGFCATSIYRNQWDKVNGAPNSAVLNLEGNINDLLPAIGGGVGISFYHDAIGFTRQNNLLLNYSYQYQVDNVGVFAAGIGLGFQNLGMNPDWVPPTNSPDASLPVGWSATAFDLNGGVYFKSYSGWYAGLSSTHLSAPRLDGATSPTFPINYDQARHYYGMGGYTFNNIGNGQIETNALVRTDFVKVSADINARYMWDYKIYGGLSYRFSDAVSFMGGADVLKLMDKINGNSTGDHFIVGYAYDLTLNKLSNISQGSHEILMKYCYYLPPVPIEKSKHVRWL